MRVKNRRRFVQESTAFVSESLMSKEGRARSASGSSQTLFNGIRLPVEWPPRYTEVPTREPMMVPYLHHIPDLIPIDVGRQLFIDDFLIEPGTLRRSYYATTYADGNPVLQGDKRWESEPLRKDEPPTPRAMVFSDGVWYDPDEKVFKMWYMGGGNKYTCFATSEDGIHWVKPRLDVVPGTNIVSTLGRDSCTVWLDQFEPDPARRYKMFLYQRPEGIELSLFFSSDGIHWSGPVLKSGAAGDRSTFFYNPFRKVWVYSIKNRARREWGRRRRYREHLDFFEGAQWSENELPWWVGADRLDMWREEYGIHPELYNLDAVAYESILLGLFIIWTGPGGRGRNKPNEVFVGFSRDGFHWHRPNRHPFVPVSDKPGAWNYGNVQSAGGCCLIVGDRLRFYVSGRRGVPGTDEPGVCSTGLATLRRDGFASLDSLRKEGQVTTRLLQFRGRYLFVNLAAAEGALRVEALNADREPIKPYTYENAEPIRSDSTLQRVRWKGADDLASLAGKPVRFRFNLRNGSLYSFWVAPDENGASHGYSAAGGPGLTGPVDTVGKVSLLIPS